MATIPQRIATTAKSWAPSPSDKYLPAFVILVMFVAVLILSASLTSSIKDICNMKNRCYDAVTARDNRNVTTVVGDDEKKTSEVQAAPSVAAANSAAASTK